VLAGFFSVMVLWLRFNTRGKPESWHTDGRPNQRIRERRVALAELQYRIED